MQHQHRDVIQLVRGHDHIHPGGAEQTLALWQALELPMGSRVLDLGAGFGGPAHWLRGAGANVLALDQEQANCLRCRQISELPMPTLRADAARLPLADRSFDGVVAWCVLGFIEDQDRLFAEILRVLMPGGRLGVDLYTVLDPALFDPGESPMPWIRDRQGWLERAERAGFTLLSEQDLTESFGAAYRAFMVRLKVQLPALRVRFGEQLVSETVATFSRNVNEVLFGGKGGLRLVLERPLAG